ncbi:MAG: hypothetical protein IJ115_03125 [Erysipelotrichaceae bacterium]|nr:hypothetical protein [Erysipelotrichaceae bacterium]
MKWREQLEKDKKQLAELKTTEKKIQFIWDYYKIPIITVTVVVAILIISAISNIGRQNTKMYVVLLNNDSLVSECDETVFNRMLENGGIDMSKSKVDVNKDLSLGREHNEAADMETLQVLTALFSISDLDVYVADKENFDYFVKEDGFANLNVLLDRNLLEEYEDDLYVYQDSRGNTVTGGIILHSDSLLHKAGYYHDDVIIGIVGRAVNLDEAVTFVNELLRSRN